MVILGLGSNIGDRQAHLQQAVDKLRALLAGLRVSAVVESPALLPVGASADWDRPFYNMAVCGEPTLTLQQLLDGVKSIERDLGRQSRGIWAPREIDIDILAMGDVVWESEGLTVPHAHLLSRDFALLPLAELAPDWTYPLSGPYHGKTAAEVVAEKKYALKTIGHIVHA